VRVLPDLPWIDVRKKKDEIQGDPPRGRESTARSEELTQVGRELSKAVSAGESHECRGEAKRFDLLSPAAWEGEEPLREKTVSSARPRTDSSKRVHLSGDEEKKDGIETEKMCSTTARKSLVTEDMIPVRASN